MKDLQVPRATLPRGRTGLGIQIAAYKQGHFHKLEIFSSVYFDKYTNIKCMLMQNVPGHMLFELCFFKSSLQHLTVCIS